MGHLGGHLMYTYAVKEVVRVLDGDTMEILIDLGFDVIVRQTIRIKGMNSPETRSKDPLEKSKGLAAKAFAESWFSDKGITVRTYKDEKYGRMLGDFFKGEENYSETAIQKGLAVAYFGGARG